jgi:hypothetical protein
MEGQGKEDGPGCREEIAVVHQAGSQGEVGIQEEGV